MHTTPIVTCPAGKPLDPGRIALLSSSLSGKGATWHSRPIREDRYARSRIGSTAVLQSSTHHSRGAPATAPSYSQGVTGRKKPKQTTPVHRDWVLSGAHERTHTNLAPKQQSRRPTEGTPHRGHAIPSHQPRTPTGSVMGTSIIVKAASSTVSSKYTDRITHVKSAGQVGSSSGGGIRAHLWGGITRLPTVWAPRQHRIAARLAYHALWHHGRPSPEDWLGMPMPGSSGGFGPQCFGQLRAWRGRRLPVIRSPAWVAGRLRRAAVARELGKRRPVRISIDHQADDLFSVCRQCGWNRRARLSSDRHGLVRYEHLVGIVRVSGRTAVTWAIASFTS